MNDSVRRISYCAYHSRLAIVSIGLVLAVPFASLSTADVITVDDDGPADYSTIQEAIDAAKDGDEVLVAPGRYTNPKDLFGDFDQQVVDLAGKAIRLHSSHGPEVTIVDGQGIQRCISCRSAEGPETEIIGFTFTNGSTENGGGGMLNASTDPIVINCIFENNHARTGGAMLNVYSSPFLFNCTFVGNTADENGGGIFSFDSMALIMDCLFSGNSALSGGAMFSRSTSIYPPTLENCTFLRNHAESGGAIHADTTDLMLDECTFVLNEAVSGGAMTNVQSNPSISNCSFVSNDAVDGGGLFNETNAMPIVTECEFMTNAASTGGAAIHNESGALSSIATTLFCGNDPNAIVGSWKDQGKNIFLYQCPLTPDINGDGLVNGNDLTILLGMWGPCSKDADPCSADLDGNSIVDGADLTILLANWTSK